MAQVIEVDFDHLTLFHLEKNYTDFLATYANGLHTGRYELSKQGNQLVLNKHFVSFFYRHLSSTQLTTDSLKACFY
ncbi:hypothetical protein [Spartinivicinus poritis]|uniref:Uncharacterized protein n=1 Tax=Spartinivicinus poritis TaxID=2994640 RepID=A0ABT5UL54_9GAMM|nr:hypothetical protein [Spartinivicinus sp. A2-2]MDE1465764.1 hypothetical protein [Spartinivicinus sp. A2-2]